jgi:MFS family permease
VPRFVDRHRFLILFALLSTLMGTSVGMAKVATSLYAVDLRAGELVLGLIAASQTIGSLLISMPIGALVDRVGPARPFMLGSLVAGSIYVVLPLAHSPLGLLACTAAISFFMPLRFVSLNTLFMHEIVQIGVEKAGWYRGTHMVGMMLIGPVVSVAATRALGFRGAYWLIAGLFALTVLVCPIVFSRYSNAPAAASGGRTRLRDLPSQLRTLAHDAELRRTALVEFAAQSLSAYFSFFIVIIAVSTLHLGEGFATQLLGLEGGAFMFALFCFGGLVTRLGDERVYAASFALVTLALLVLGLFQAQWLLSAGSIALGLGLGSLQIVNLTRFAFIGGRLGRGKVSGLTPFIGTSGSLLGSFLGGVIGHTLGLQYVFLAYALAFAGLLAAAPGLAGARQRAELLPDPSPRA